MILYALTVNEISADQPGFLVDTFDPAYPIYVITTDEGTPPVGTDMMTYSDVSTIDNWARCAPELIGISSLLKDWHVLRAIIEDLVVSVVQSDYSLWNNLTNAQKVIACTYFPNDVPASLFAATIPSATVRAQLRHQYNLKSREAHLARLNAASEYVGGVVTNAGFMEITDDISNVLFTKYILGIESKAKNGYEGILDYVQGTAGTSYEGGGIPAKSLVFYDLGMTIEAFTAVLVAIIQDGQYL